MLLSLALHHLRHFQPDTHANEMLTNRSLSQMFLMCLCVCAAVTVGLRGPGGDGAAQEGAHRGSEGDQEAAGRLTPESFCRIQSYPKKSGLQ